MPSKIKSYFSLDHSNHLYHYYIVLKFQLYNYGLFGRYIMFVVLIVSRINYLKKINKNKFLFQGARYSRIIREEKLYDLMQKLYNDQISSDHSDTFIIQLLKSILHLLKPYHSNHHHQNSSAVASR